MADGSHNNKQARSEAKGDEEAEEESELSFALAFSPSSCCSFHCGAQSTPGRASVALILMRDSADESSLAAKTTPA
jgi:hypothetical protein